MERRGILAGGNFIMDVVKMVDSWPSIESLANIHHQYNSNGGGAYNLLKNLSALEVDFPLEAVGLIGHDNNGEMIRKDCESCGIITHQLQSTSEAKTSYTDVMTTLSDGRRTFFHYRGANALLNRKHFQLEKSHTRIFHLAYMLLLDQLDSLDEHGISEASKLLEQAGKMGFMTSADLVSVNDDRFEKVIRPALPFIDILFLNEFEAEKITGFSIVSESRVQLNRAVDACRQLITMGIRQWVLLHFPEGAVAMHAQGDFLLQGSVMLPSDKIAGAVGAGDAFAAGVLAEMHDGKPMEAALKMGVCAAAACLTHATCSGGILPQSACLQFGVQYGFRTFEG
jgi:sugar/nucleoside kinase (ribokinase family)